jgi:hypothetical protein
MNEADQENDLPRRIADRLAARENAVAVVTPHVDAAIKRSAAEHFAGRSGPARVAAGPRRIRRAVPRRWAVGAAAAAVLVTLLVIRPAGELGRAPVLVDDFDGSGRVDILDAFAMARTRAADPAEIDQADIDSLAARIVSLQAATRTL